MAVMGFISRVLLPRVRVTLPQYTGTAVSPVYLGMPPLPIGGLRNAASTSISGVSTGRINVVTEPIRTTDIEGRTKGRGIRIPRARTNNAARRTKSNNSQGVQKTKKKGKPRGAVVKRGKGGKFTK